MEAEQEKYVEPASECGNYIWDAAAEITRVLSWMNDSARKKAIKLALVAMNSEGLMVDGDEEGGLRSAVEVPKGRAVR